MRCMPWMLLLALACGWGVGRDTPVDQSDTLDRTAKHLGVSRLGRAPALSPAMLEALAAPNGRVLVQDANRAAALAETLDAVALTPGSAAWSALQARSETEAADALLAEGLVRVVVRPAAAASVDRDRSVLSRLLHHDHLERFSLLRVGDDAYAYAVLETPVPFSKALAAEAVAHLRHRLGGGARRQGPLGDPDDGPWTLVASLRSHGRELSVAFAQNRSLIGALEEIVVDLERDHRRKVEPIGFPPLAEHIGGLSIELHRVTERAYVEPRDTDALAALWEPGIDGFYLLGADRKERGALPGSAAYTRAIVDVDRMLRHTAMQGKMGSLRPWRDAASWLEVFRSVHFREDPGQGLVRLFRGVPVVPMEDVTQAAAEAGILAAGDWYLRNLNPQGQVVYKFWPAENRYSSEYNLVRHTLATWNLVQAWQVDSSRTDFLEASRRALDFTERFVVWEPSPAHPGEEMAFYRFNDNQKLGTVVVNILGMVALSEATGDRSWDEQLQAMGRFVQFMQEEDGTFRGYYVEEGHPYFGQTNDIVPGEAALALLTLARHFDDDAWLTGLDAYWSHYRAWFDARVALGDWDRPWPGRTYDNATRLELVQFGPWTVMAANAHYRRTQDPAVAQLGLDVARWMVEAYAWTEERSPWPDYIGGYYKLPGELPAMQAFCYAEGTAAAYLLALAAGRADDAAYFERATRQTVRFALQMQYDQESTYAFTRPAQVDGGIRYAMNETKVRIDYVHHGLSALAQWADGVGTDPNVERAVLTGPALPAQQRRAAERTARLAGLPEGTPDPAVVYTGARWPVPLARIAPPAQETP